MFLYLLPNAMIVSWKVQRLCITLPAGRSLIQTQVGFLLPLAPSREDMSCWSKSAFILELASGWIHVRFTFQPFSHPGKTPWVPNGLLLETVFSVRSAQSGYKEELVENQQSSSGVLSEQSVESWALQGRLIRWLYDFRCGVLTSWQRRYHGSWSFDCVKSVARKRLVETVIDWGH
jgi:hypothetical protein